MACSGVYLTSSAHELADCLERSSGEGCSAQYVSHSEDYGFCYSCTAAQVAKRVPQAGYAIYATGCGPSLAPASAASAARAALPSHAPAAPSPAPSPLRIPGPGPGPSPGPDADQVGKPARAPLPSPPPPSPSPPPPSPSPPPPAAQPLAPFALLHAGFACGGGSDVVSVTADSAYACQLAVARSGRDLARFSHWAFSQPQRLCVACSADAVRRRTRLSGFDLFQGVAFSPPRPPAPPPNYKPRPPPSPHPPPSPSPPLPPPPPVVRGVVAAGKLCGRGASTYGLSGGGLEQPHYPLIASAQACAHKLSRLDSPFFAWSPSLNWCLGCTRDDLHTRVRADARYDIYQTAALHPQGLSDSGPDPMDDPFAAFKQGEQLGANPFSLHLGHTHKTGAMGLHELFGMGQLEDEAEALPAAARGGRAVTLGGLLPPQLLVVMSASVGTALLVLLLVNRIRRESVHSRLNLQ